MLQQGIRLNDTYILLEQLGSGGGGVVYKAYHERLQKYVVVKQIKDQVKGILEGRAEADILKELKHANLPQVYDFLEIDEEIYTVMDFVPGESLDKALEHEKSFDSKTVYQWALQLANALAYLHNQKPPVIHSDIKPANVMLTPKGDICLIDFNISLAFDEGRRTSTGISGGYSPPEQHHNFSSYLNWIQEIDTREVLSPNQSDNTSVIEKTEIILEKSRAYSPENKTELLIQEESGEKKIKETELLIDTNQTMSTKKFDSSNRVKKTICQTESIVSDIVGRGVDERSDIYSLGATLYHLITGVKPTEDFDSLKPISDFDVKLGEGFRIIIEKMMELEPAKRYQNGGELLYALEHVYELDSEYKRFRRRRRNKKIFVAILYIVGASLVGNGWMTLGRERLTDYNRTVEQASIYIENFQYSQAEDMIQKAKELLPNHIMAYEKEVLLLYSLGDYEGTISYGRDVINNPAYVLYNETDEKTLGNIFYILGNAYFEQTDYANAANCFEEAIQRNSENSLYFRDYAITLAKTGQSDVAEKILETAIHLGLGEDSIYMVQGEIAYSRGENAAATEKLLSAVRASESEELKRRATILCAQIYQQMGDQYLGQEIELLQNSVNSFGIEVSKHLKEQLADAYARKAKQSEQYAMEYYPKSLELFQELYKDGYSTRQMMENIAILYQQMERIDEAEEMLNQMIEKYPEDYRAYKRLAFLEADKQQKKENEERNYTQMKVIYDKAIDLYQEANQEGDTEMQMLENMIKDLIDGGWL